MEREHFSKDSGIGTKDVGKAYSMMFEMDPNAAETVWKRLTHDSKVTVGNNMFQPSPEGSNIQIRHGKVKVCLFSGGGSHVAVVGFSTSSGEQKCAVK